MLKEEMIVGLSVKFTKRTKLNKSKIKSHIFHSKVNLCKQKYLICYIILHENGKTRRNAMQKINL